MFSICAPTVVGYFEITNAQLENVAIICFQLELLIKLWIISYQLASQVTQMVSHFSVFKWFGFQM